VLVDVDEGNNDGVYDDVLGYGKIVTIPLMIRIKNNEMRFVSNV
jgi:hypothetical protein